MMLIFFLLLGENNDTKRLPEEFCLRSDKVCVYNLKLVWNLVGEKNNCHDDSQDLENSNNFL